MNIKPIMIGIWTVLLAIIVLAAAPTTPSILSPDNNAVVFDTVRLTCDGSTDGDGDTIYYSFYDTSSMSYTNEFTRHGAVDSSGTGQNYGYLRLDNGQIANWTTEGIYFYKDNVTIQLKMTASMNRYRIYVDNTTEVFSTTTPMTSWVDVMLNVSPFNDGQPHTIAFDAKSGSDDQYIYFNWTHNLSWNKTSYLAVNTTSPTYNISNVWMNGTYNWTCQACDTNGDCSAFTSNRTLTPTRVVGCGPRNATRALNFTVYDEENISKIISNIEFALDLGTSWANTTFYYSSNETENQTLCVEPSGVKVNVTDLVEYAGNDTVQYPYPRQYYFDDNEIQGGTLEEIDLYLLTGGLSTAITFTVTRNGEAVEDITIQVERYTPGTGIYTVVAMGQTSSQGTDVIYLRQTDAWYRIIAIENGDIVYNSGALHITDTSFPIALSGEGEGVTGYWTDWNGLEGINWTLTWNASGTNLIVLDVVQPSGGSSRLCLRTETWDNQNGSITQNDTCTTAVSAILTYNTHGDLEAHYTSKFFVRDGDIWRLFDTLDIRLDTGLAGLIGKDGPVYAFMLIGILAFVGIFNPAVAVLLAMVGLIFSYFIGFVTVSWVVIAALLIAGMVIFFKLRT